MEQVRRENSLGSSAPATAVNFASAANASPKRLFGRFYEYVANNIYAIMPLIIQVIVIVISRILFKIFANYKVEGLENVKGLPKGTIFASNHSSELDAILVTSSLPLFSHYIPMFYTSLDKTFYKKFGLIKGLFYGGIFFKMLGAYSVMIGAFNYERSLRKHIAILNDGHSICIFPEGKRYTEGKLGEAKGGVGYLVYRTGKPVVPVAVLGATRTTLSDFFTFRRRFKVTFGKPLYPGELFTNIDDITISQEHDDCRIAAKHIMSNISIMLNQK